jgi:hypothetical protein
MVEVEVALGFQGRGWAKIALPELFAVFLNAPVYEIAAAMMYREYSPRPAISHQPVEFSNSHHPLSYLPPIFP